MKVYLQPDNDSRGILRVAQALTRYAPPSIDIVSSPQDADCEVIHVYGRHDKVRDRIIDLRAKGRQYVMIQYCMRSTMRPNTFDWMRMWQQSKFVWSYYDLFKLCDEDKTRGEFNFYYAPLGVDSDVFVESGAKGKGFIIAACSQHALAEGAKECALAAKRVKMPMFFLGHDLRRGDDIVCRTGMSDTELARWYSECKYVSGLRRCEGFELPVLEGALCGARPIVYDRPHYRKWFNEFAIFIPELDRDSVIDSLEKVFNGYYGQITDNDKMLIRDRFNWETIAKGFWDRVIS